MPFDSTNFPKESGFAILAKRTGTCLGIAGNGLIVLDRIAVGVLGWLAAAFIEGMAAHCAANHGHSLQFDRAEADAAVGAVPLTHEQTH